MILLKTKQRQRYDSRETWNQHEPPLKTHPYGIFIEHFGEHNFGIASQNYAYALLNKPYSWNEPDRIYKLSHQIVYFKNMLSPFHYIWPSLWLMRIICTTFNCIVICSKNSICMLIRFRSICVERGDKWLVYKSPAYIAVRNYTI